MRIIKEGTLPESKEYEQTCYVCGTIFVFSKGETRRVDIPYNGDPRENSYDEIECPFCHKKISASYNKRAGEPKVHQFDSVVSQFDR